MRANFVHPALIAMLATTSVVGLAAPAQAQEKAAEPASEATTNIDVNEIIVSARRRNESLQTTPVAITAINRAMLENKASVNIGDLQGTAPNLLITQQNSGAQAANLSIRGLTYADIEKSQTPTVGVVIDGVTIGTNTGQLLDFFDIEQIEVLRGPQGTLFGANTIGGVINIRRTRPTMETGAKLEATYGRWNSWNSRALINVGNGESLGLKAWYFHSQTDGFLYNAITRSDAGGSKNDNYGASLLFKPKDTDFDALLTVENTHQTFDPTVGNIAQTGELFCMFEPANECNRNRGKDLYTVFTSPATSRYTALAATLEMNYDAGAVKLTSITGWRHSKEYQTQDFDAASTDLYYVLRQQHYTQWSQEVRASGNVGSNIDYVVGGYYFNSHYDLVQHTRLFAFNAALDPLVADPNPQSVAGRTESYAAFGDFNWAFADKFRLSLGGRWSHDNKQLMNSFAAPGRFFGANFSKFTPKVGIDYRPNRDMMLYASWSKGYRSGGFSPRAATVAAASVPFQTETVDSYEAGAKLDLFDRKLQFNFAGFIAKYKNLQQSTTIPGGPNGNQTVISNAGAATIKGIEMDAALRPADGLKFTATLAVLDSHFSSFTVGNVYNGAILPFDYSRNDLIYAPKFSASLGAEYTMPTGFGNVVASTGLRHIASYDQQISLGALTPVLSGSTVTSVIVNGNDPRTRTAPQNLVDASLTVNFKLHDTDAYLRIFGRNLLDERTTAAAFTVAGLWSFATAIEPRTYGVTVGVKF